jgi:hypothetical protein
MRRNTWKPALALGAVLATCGATSADDRDTRPLFGGPSATTMTLGGTGTAARAATEDTELTGGRRYGGYYGGYYGYRGGYGGYRGGYYGGYGYRGYYYGGYRPYYGGYSSFSYYRPAYYYAPRVYYPSYYYATYPVYPTYGGVGIYLGIGGGAGTGAPAVQLGTSFAQPAASQPMAPPVAPGDGTFPYDGGPANPVPLPKADPQAIPPANPTATDLPISLKPKTATTPYKYKAYGEK